MFATLNDVVDVTGYENVDVATVRQAQTIIESYIGRLEVDVTDAADLVMLARATAYQAAYMQSDPLKVFEQIAFKSLGQFGQLVSFRETDDVSPFIAPLARIACKNLSWRKPRSIKTGSIYGQAPQPVGWANL